MNPLVRWSVCLVAVATSFSVSFAGYSSEDVVAVTGHLPRAALPHRTLAPTAPTDDLRVVIGLKLRHQDELDQLLEQLGQPDSPGYRRYLGAAEFDARFGPASSDIASVVAYLDAQGLSVSEVSNSGLLISAHGPVTAVERAFHVHLANFTSGDESFYAPDQDPTLPRSLASMVASIQGLENQTRLIAQNTGPRLPPQEGHPFAPRDIAGVYNFTPLYEHAIRGDDTRAATVAIATAFGFRPADVTTFWSALGVDRPADRLEVIPVGGEAPHPIDETTLDVEWAGAMAPRSRLLVYVGASSAVTTFIQVYDRIVSDNRAAVMSLSWGLCERSMPQVYLDQAHAIFQKAAALGISIVVASGDSGAFDCGGDTPGVDTPASDPLVTAVGGTSLQLDRNGRRGREDAWQGSGGGMSNIWLQPPWQMSFSGWRQSADIALNADPGSGYYVVNDGAWWSYGGTSLGAPIWAALLALANQLRAQTGQGPVGLANPAVCDATTQPGATNPLTDITQGDNGHFPATSGWDYPTGWGVPDAWALAGALAAPANARTVDGGMHLLTYLTPVSSPAAGSVRVNLTFRCSRTRLTVTVGHFPSGVYRLTIDDEPVVEFVVTRSGRGRGELSGANPRGHRIALIDTIGRRLFTGVFPTRPQTPLRMRAALTPPRFTAGAAGIVSYQRAFGAEQFTVAVNGVPAGNYTLFASNQPVAVLRVVAHAGGQTSGVVRFDSRGAVAPPPPFSLCCQPLHVRRDNATVLELTATTAGTGICPGA